MNIIDLRDKVFRFTAERQLFAAPCHILLGLSGGADSMALLHVLSHWSEPGLTVSAVHVHHGLRGEEADRDEQFVREYCENNGIPLSVYRVDVAVVAAEERLSVEEAGRRVRYDLFEKLRLEIGADFIVTAHTAGDQAETVLMHLIRGCGVDGLCGIPAVRGRIRRPLLGVTRREIEEYCRSFGVPYIIDATNEDVRYTRNAVRHNILPALREINPSVDEALLRLSGCAADDVAYLNGLAASALCLAANSDGYLADIFQDQPSVVRRRMIRQMIQNANVSSFDEVHIVAADHAIMRGQGAVALPGGYLFSVQQGRASIRFEEGCPLPIPVEIRDLPFTTVFSERTVELFVDEATNVYKLFENSVIDFDKIQGMLRLRCRQTGDYFHPAGRGVGKSIKKLMNEWQIPSHQRDSYPLLCDDGGVILVPGYACDERVCATEDTKHFLVCKTGAEQG